MDCENIFYINNNNKVTKEKKGKLNKHYYTQ
jgi:hypothetical protein